MSGWWFRLALACHIRLADESAQVGLPEIKLGIIPGYGGTQRSPRLFGKAAAYELILSGNFISGTQAETYRIVNRATQKGTVLKEAQELAKAIAARSRLAVKAAMQAIAQGYTMEFYTALTFERELLVNFVRPKIKKKALPHSLKNASLNLKTNRGMGNLIIRHAHYDELEAIARLDALVFGQNAWPFNSFVNELQLHFQNY